MNRTPVQVASPELDGITVFGTAVVLTQNTSNAEVSFVSGQRAAKSRAAFAAMRRAPRRLISIMLALAALLPMAAGAHAQVSFGSQNDGTTSGAQSVTVTAQVAATVNSVLVLTSGVPSLDFAVGTGTSNCLVTLAKGATCTESVTFTPSVPGLRMGAVVLLDNNSNVIGTAYLSGIGLGGLGVLVSGNMPGIAGQGRLFSGPLGDGGPATQASLNLPSGVALDGSDNLYIADSLHYRVRIVNAKTGIITTVAGIGQPGYTGDNGPANKATLNTPSGVAIDGAGNLFIADTGNNVVRKVTASTGIITTVAGNGLPGTPANVGDGGQAVLGNLSQPIGVTVDAGGNLFIADYADHRIRRVDAVTGIITTVAGNGTTNPGTGVGGFAGDGGPATKAELNFPYTVGFDTAGNMYIPDSLNNRVRMVNTSGFITTYAGNGTPSFGGDGGPATSASLFSPEGVVADPAGNIYISDTQNAAIRKVSSATSATAGEITSIALNARGEDLYIGALYPLSIYAPVGITMDGSGNIYVANYYNQLVQEIQSNFVVLDFRYTPIRQGSISAPMLQEVENDGNSPFDVTSITYGPNVTFDPTTTTCVMSPPLMTVNEDCKIGVVFAPSKSVVIPPPNISQQIIDNVDVAGNTVNTPLDIQVWAIATVVNATTTTLTANPNPSGYGNNVSFTATVTTGVGTGPLTGTVTFYIDGVVAPGPPIILNQAGVAVFSTNTLTVGVHQITASYADNNSPPLHFPSTSAPLTETVLEGTVTALVSSQNPSAIGQSVTFTATVTVPPGGGNVPPDGTVLFYDGAAILGATTLSASGVATFTTSTLTNGAHSITAVYGGDSNNQITGSTSAVLTQEVLASSGVTIVSSLNPSVYGLSVTFTVTIATTGAAPASGTVNILDGGVQIGTATLAAGMGTFTTSSLVVGSHAISAAYLGDVNYGPGNSPAINQVVTQASTTTAVAASPNPAFAGGTVALTASVKITKGSATPTGVVTFTSGAVTLGSAALGASGTATVNATFAVGNYNIVATYSGDLNDAGSISAPLPLTVQIASTTTAVTATPNPAIVTTPVALTAKVTSTGGIPTGSVTFFADGVSIGTSALDVTGTATLSISTLPTGTHVITATYAGDVNNTPSTSPAYSLVVGTIPTATALGATSSSAPNSQVALVATVIGSSGPTPTGTVTFTNNGTVIGAATLNSSGVATLNPNLSTGTYSIVANYGGDPLHSPSASLPATVLGTPLDFNIAVNPQSVTIKTSQSATVNITFTSISGFTDTLGLGCASLPAAVNCHFSSPSVTLAANGTQTAQVTIDTNNPLSGGSGSLITQPNSHGPYLAALSLLGLPISVLFGFFVWRFRKRHSTVFTAILVLLLSGAAMLVNGCSAGFSQVTATPGTYVIQISATGTNSDVIHYQNVTLNITP